MCSRPTSCKAGFHRRDSAGITLLELLAVMCITVILMSLSIMAYNGAIRNVGLEGAVTDLRAVFTMARQYAVSHRCRTEVWFEQDGSSGRCIVIAQSGMHEGLGNSQNLVVLAPTWEWNTFSGNSNVVYNMTSGARSIVTTNTDTMLYTQLTGGSSQVWMTGDRYGWMVHDEIDLPEGIVFNDGSPASVPERIAFKSDGTTPKPLGQHYEVVLRELRGSMTRKIVVNGISGMMTVTE